MNYDSLLNLNDNKWGLEISSSTEVLYIRAVFPEGTSIWK